MDLRFFLFKKYQHPEWFYSNFEQTIIYFWAEQVSPWVVNNLSQVASNIFHLAENSSHFLGNKVTNSQQDQNFHFIQEIPTLYLFEPNIVSN